MRSASSIPYQLRPNKAIERNLFIDLLKRLDKHPNIELKDYRYVGFGAPFLEDFKLLHLELDITDMHCLEYDKVAFSRQLFNNPYNFVIPINLSSTDYITSQEFKEDKNQIVWLDYATPKEFRQQLIDIELATQKMTDLDILKFTFNSSPKGLMDAEGLESLKPDDLLNFFKKDETYQYYLPDKISAKDINNNFHSLLRSMGLRAAKRGLAKKASNLEFSHLTSFHYGDGQAMTTMTGIITKKGEFENVINHTRLQDWKFYDSSLANELSKSFSINVPAMTMLERLKIDKLIPIENVKEVAKELGFNYDSSEKENESLLDNYCRYYKHLPYFSRTTY